MHPDVPQLALAIDSMVTMMQDYDILPSKLNQDPETLEQIFKQECDPVKNIGPLAYLWAPERLLSFLPQSDVIAITQTRMGNKQTHRPILPIFEGYDMAGMLSDMHDAYRSWGMAVASMLTYDPAQTRQLDEMLHSLAVQANLEGGDNQFLRQKKEKAVAAARAKYFGVITSATPIFRDATTCPHHEADIPEPLHERIPGSYPSITPITPETLVGRAYAMREIARGSIEELHFSGLVQIGQTATTLAYHVIELEQRLITAAWEQGLDIREQMPSIDMTRVRKVIQRNRRGLELCDRLERLHGYYGKPITLGKFNWVLGGHLSEDRPLATCLQLVGGYPYPSFTPRNDLEAGILMMGIGDALFDIAENSEIIPAAPGEPAGMDDNAREQHIKRLLHASQIQCRQLIEGKADRKDVIATLKELHGYAKAFKEAGILPRQRGVLRMASTLTSYFRHTEPNLPAQAKPRTEQRGRA